MVQPKMPTAEPIYAREGEVVVFNQLAVKIEMDGVSNDDYYAWLDDMKAAIGRSIAGAEIAEKPGARETPPLNTAIYYDTPDLQILETGALLRTSCNKITHAFCAFKAAEDENKVRRDHRYVFDGIEKQTIQSSPDSDASVAIVKRLLARTDINHPGTYLRSSYGIDPRTLIPTVRLDDYRYTFFGWLHGRDALRCSIDRAFVTNLRLPPEQRREMPVTEVELAIYPRIDPEVARDPAVVDMITLLRDDLCRRFDTRVTTDIKYQRAATALSFARS